MPSPRSHSRRHPPHCSSQCSAILLEEYRVLYTLALFRMSSLERRVPIGVGAMAAFLASALVLPPEGQLVLLVALPISLIWLLRTTINHVRSFEDAIRRIEEIEVAVNTLVGMPLLLFQSSHPSRGRNVGGRTGSETVESVVIACALTLLACLYLLIESPLAALPLAPVYPLLVVVVAVALIHSTLRLRAYRYARNESASLSADPR